MPSKHAPALVIGLSLTLTANAEEYRQHDAHIHGQVEFNIAQDGKDLLVEITAPGADVVGFEHEPENSEKKLVLKQALTALKDTGKLFIINQQAKCAIEDVHVAHSLEHHVEHEGHEDHDKHEHEAHDEHAHDDHQNHDALKHEEHDHENEHGGHGEFSAQYRFHCDSVSDLNNISTTWFKQFPTTESVTVNLFTDTTQSAIKLSKDNATITIK